MRACPYFLPASFFFLRYSLTSSAYEISLLHITDSPYVRKCLIHTLFISVVMAWARLYHVGRHGGLLESIAFCYQDYYLQAIKSRKDGLFFILCGLHENWQWLKLSIAIGSKLEDDLQS